MSYYILELKWRCSINISSNRNVKTEQIINQIKQIYLQDSLTEEDQEELDSLMKNLSDNTDAYAFDEATRTINRAEIDKFGKQNDQT